MIALASQKRIVKRIPMIIANQAVTAMGHDDNTVTIIDDSGHITLPQSNKVHIAQQILTYLSQQLNTAA